MFDIKEFPLLNNSICPLKETSKDSKNNAYMTESPLSVVDFDNVALEYKNSKHFLGVPKSNDAFFISGNGDAYFIEFKNGKINYKNNKKKSLEVISIQLKIAESLHILMDITGIDILYARENLNYILVYNDEKNPLADTEKAEIAKTRATEIKTSFKKHFQDKKAEKRLIRFSLSRFEKLYFRNVYTLTEEEFENQFVSKWSETN